ncbi:MAG: hypothetical protein KJO78_06905, partial [Alphaproteobacteria bacterium]|nr:hypothetical protein [Alphaproteobacteria bacterium]
PLDGGKDGFSNDHGPFRTSGWDKVHIDACSFYSTNGWSGGPAGRTAAQACIRVNTEGEIGAEWFVSRVACEGGFVMIDADAASSSRPDNPWNFVIDKALLVGTAQTTNQIVLGSSGTTLRNIIGIMPNVAYESGISEFVTYLTDNPQNNVLNEPVRLHNCTFLNLDDADDMAMVAGGQIWNDYTEVNNVFHAPDQPGAVTGQGPIDTAAPSGFSAVYPGRRISTQKVRVTPGGTVGTGGTVTSIPYPAGTGPSDFTAADAHAVLAGSDYHFAAKGEIAVAFGASSISVTNLSGSAWSAGTQLTFNFKRIAHTTEPASASPGFVPLPRPGAGSSARTASGGLLAYHDATGQPAAASPFEGALPPV